MLPSIGAGFVTPSLAASQAQVVAVGPASEEEADEAGRDVRAQVGARVRAEQPLDAVVLVVVPGVVLGAHQRVAERDLPGDHPDARERDERRAVEEVAVRSRPA